ncbi:MAG TPA: efflux RND transporter periplasmic adaptor subunit [Xanthobacteraceae bacterium]|jgi:cobalt-zinc-cadmium efflux system membrane fusion protein|nr:efflux RND transporter periplasmic adaptor subunit [Xanthobacteraceae bacterium]
MAPRTTDNRLSAVVAAALLVVIAIVYWVSHFGTAPKPGQSGTPAAVASSPAAKIRDSVDLSDSQLEAVKVEPVDEHDFPVEKEAVGSIDFNEDLAVQVFTPYQGRIISLFAEVGDDVKKGQTLFTIDSPDLLQAESTLIAAAGVLDLNRKNLDRLQGLYTTRAVSQHDVEQAASDEQTAEGNLRAARDAVRLFGKSDADIDRIIADRSADPTLLVPSPIAGRITARNAAPGLFVQPGNPPAPFTVADIDTMWMLANVAEGDSPAFRLGQPVQVTVDAFPGRVFEGKVTTIGASVDPNTRRVLVRSEVKDRRHELRSGMFANFVIDVGTPQRSPGIPLDGVVREGDGTMTVWVTADRRRFTKRTVKIGKEHGGYRQILDGVQPGELVATEGAIFLSNELAIEQ